MPSAIIASPAALVVAALVCVAAAAQAQSVPHGPLSVRDGQVFAQGRPFLPAQAAATLAPGQVRWRMGVLWANSFAWTQDRPGEAPSDRRFLVDGETLTLDGEWERGLRDGLTLTARLPLHLRGGGIMDGFLDAAHRTLGLDDGGRAAFRRNAWRVEGRTPDGRALSWPASAALGDLELGARRSLGSAGRAALQARLSLPSSTGPLRERGPSLGLQVVAVQPLGEGLWLQAGAGAVARSTREVQGVSFERLRGQAFLGVERRCGHGARLHLQADLASRLVDGVDRYPGRHVHVLLGLSLDAGPGRRLEAAVIENLVDQQATADLAFHVAWVLGGG